MTTRHTITYLSEIVSALEQLGGSGTLKEINEIIENKNLLPAIRTNSNWKDNVRATIQRHCKGTKSYRGATDLFYSVYGLGEGFWGLKDYISDETAEVTIENRICNQIRENANLRSTEKEMLIKARTGQGVFRERLIEKYHKCIITGISDTRLLIASHIHPWRSANNEDRLSSENGLLLSPLYDKLFDIGLISFSKEMRIIISNGMRTEDVDRIRINTNQIYIHSPSQELKRHMEYHRDTIFRN